MRRLAPFALALVALGLASGLLAGCNANAAPFAAKVGSTTISTASLDDALNGIKGDSGYTCLFENGQSVSGVGSDTYNSSYVRFVLTNLIQSRLVEQLAADRHLAEPSWVYAVAETQLQAALSQGLANSSCGSERAIWTKLSQGYRDELVRFQVAEDALSAWIEGTSLSSSALGAYASSHPSSSVQDCISVIEVTTRKEAVSLRADIVKGASFSLLARTHSVDSASAAAGGAIGCVTPSGIVSSVRPLVTSLQPGVVSSPFLFGGKWDLLEVTSRMKESDAVLLSTLFSEASARLSQLERSASKTVQVTVDPEYGTWSAKTSQVSPPKSPPAKDMPNPNAVTPTTGGSPSPLSPVG